MRRPLLIFACLSTLALAQNGFAAMAPEAASLLEPATMAAGESTGKFVASTASMTGVATSGEGPQTGAMALLMAGLSGLTIAGGRRHDRERVRA